MHAYPNGFRTDIRRLRILDHDVVIKQPRKQTLIERPGSIVCNRPEERTIKIKHYPPPRFPNSMYSAISRDTWG